MQQQTLSPPPVAPRNPGAIRVMSFSGTEPTYHGIRANGSSSKQALLAPVQAEREVEILNHCFDDIEAFMGRLQKSAEAQSVLSQKKKKKKSRRKKETDYDLLTARACPPKEDEFIDIFQKFKYCFSLLARLKPSISNPTSEELLHHIFLPLDMIVKTTGGPALGATVSSPALTNEAVSLLHDNLIDGEKQLWESLGPNWTLSRSQQSNAVPSYTPYFLDGWKPKDFGPDGQHWEDPIELQHKQDQKERQEQSSYPSPGQNKAPDPSSDETSTLPPEGDRLYTCSYDFVARNSSELSVLHGETLEVLDSSKRWWKCRNRFDQIGFVPSNILEPLSALGDMPQTSPVTHRQSKASPSKHFSYTHPSPPDLSTLPPNSPQPRSPAGEDSDKVMVMNSELQQRLANGRPVSVRQLVIPRATDTTTPLNYHSPSPQVMEWLRGKGFSEPTVQCLGVLNGAQLFSLNKEELRSVSPEEGARVYSQIMVQKALLEDVRKATELEAVMKKQKMKVDLTS